MSDRQSGPPRRAVYFRGRSDRVVAGVLGAGLVLAGWLAIGPTLAADRPPAKPWTLAVGGDGKVVGLFSDDATDATDDALPLRTQVWMRTGPRCSNPVRVSGVIRGDTVSLSSLSEWAVAVDGTKVTDPHFYNDAIDIDPALMTPREQAAAEIRPRHFAIGDVPIWRKRYFSQRSPDTVGFSFEADVARQDGFNRCWISTPQLLEHGNGAMDATYPPHQESPFDAIAGHGGGFGPLFNVRGASVTVLAGGWLPDDSSLDAEARVGQSIDTSFGYVADRDQDDPPGPVVVVACSASKSDTSGAAEADRYSAEPLLSLCQGSLHFQRAGVQASTTRRTLVSGLLLSAGVGLLLEALILGRSHPSQVPPGRESDIVDESLERTS